MDAVTVALKALLRQTAPKPVEEGQPEPVVERTYAEHLAITLVHQAAEGNMDAISRVLDLIREPQPLGSRRDNFRRIKELCSGKPEPSPDKPDNDA